MKDCISRRTFLKTAVGAGACLYGLNYLSSLQKPKPLKTLKEAGLKRGLVMVHGSHGKGRT
ncbi:MAG TPA: twin-arginine translocation signal domain-containing protein, partial [Candidatus Hypogeohydataceae bacterium YC40]